ncbi:MAG TPA: diguanylate cyclase [Solimonas sp.]|nr:diguanylate cyclase [Solimonas sp.]
MRILLVDDNPVDRLIAERALRAAYPEAEIVLHHSAAGLAQQLREQPCDCLLLDYRMPGLDGLASLREIEAAALEQLPAIIMLTGMGDEGIAVEAMKRGATDYLRKDDINPELLQHTIRSAIERTALKRQLAAYQSQMERMALNDALTGLGNRVAFDRELEQFAARSSRGGLPFSLLLIDLDKFKAINDTHGHPAGDAVLKAAAECMRTQLRLSDGAFRLGGDEFAILLDGVAIEPVGRRLQLAFSKPVSFGEALLQYGASIGAARWPLDASTPEDLYTKADQAMYEAKRAGGSPH